MHRFVLVSVTDMAADGESAVLLRGLYVPVIRKPFDPKTVFAVVNDIIARSIVWPD